VPPMPLPQRNWAALRGGNRLIQEQRNYSHDSELADAQQNIGKSLLVWIISLKSLTSLQTG
jgi:hypothetical protein